MGDHRDRLIDAASLIVALFALVVSGVALVRVLVIGEGNPGSATTVV